MDIQQYIIALNELISKYSQLKEAKDLNKVLVLSRCVDRDMSWYYSVQNLIESFLDTYPTLKYYIDKHRDGRSGNPDFKAMADYLVIAGMCIVTELYVETHKNN